jgi:hypothetical protein
MWGLPDAHKEDNLSHWINELKKRKYVNIATVAVANKTARISWAIITGDDIMKINEWRQHREY